MKNQKKREMCFFTDNIYVQKPKETTTMTNFYNFLLKEISEVS